MAVNRQIPDDETTQNIAVNETHEIGYPVHVYFLELAKLFRQRVPWHWHPEIEIIIINHGEVDFLTSDNKIRLKAGQGVLINENVMHAVHPVDADASCSLYSLIFHPSFLFGYGNTTMSGKFLVPVLSSPILRTMVLDESDALREKLLDSINDIIAVNLAKKYGYELMTKASLCQFWLLLLEQVIPQNVHNTRHHNISLDESRVKEAIRYIEEHYAEHISLEQLASSIHISKSECCRCFKRTLKVTPVEYLMRYRIFKAAKMIQSEDPCSRSMSSLAFNVGFNNASYFNKVFREHMKCTPSEYKKEIKKDPTGDPFRIVSL